MQRPARRPSFYRDIGTMVTPPPSPLGAQDQEKPSPSGARAVENEIAARERRSIELTTEKTELTTAMMLLRQDTNENRRRLTLVNAEMHTAGEELKRLYRMRSGSSASDQSEV